MVDPHHISQLSSNIDPKVVDLSRKHEITLNSGICFGWDRVIVKHGVDTD
jgi:hypothetical protein